MSLPPIHPAVGELLDRVSSAKDVWRRRRLPYGQRPLSVRVGIAEWADATGRDPPGDGGAGLPWAGFGGFDPRVIRRKTKERVREAFTAVLEARAATANAKNRAEVERFSLILAKEWSPDLETHVRALARARAIEAADWLFHDQSHRTRYQAAQCLDVLADWFSRLGALRRGETPPVALVPARLRKVEP